MDRIPRQDVDRVSQRSHLAVQVFQGGKYQGLESDIRGKVGDLTGAGSLLGLPPPSFVFSSFGPLWSGLPCGLEGSGKETQKSTGNVRDTAVAKCRIHVALRGCLDILQTTER